MSGKESRKLFVISDTTADTARRLLQAIRFQFPEGVLNPIIHQGVTHKNQIDHLIESISQKKGGLLITVIDPDLRENLLKLCHKKGVPFFDLLGGVVEGLGGVLGLTPTATPKLPQDPTADSEYLTRINAIEYTVKHDDGASLATLNQADILLIGVSRTSKTPLSIYLGCMGYKTANFPVVPGVPFPEEINQFDPGKIIGLIVKPQVLENIRRERLSSLGIRETQNYNDMKSIMDELESVEKLYRQKGYFVLDTTHKAIEEVAGEVIKLISLQF